MESFNILKTYLDIRAEKFWERVGYVFAKHILNSMGTGRIEKCRVLSRTQQMTNYLDYGMYILGVLKNMDQNNLMLMRKRL